MSSSFQSYLLVLIQFIELEWLTYYLFSGLMQCQLLYNLLQCSGCQSSSFYGYMHCCLIQFLWSQFDLFCWLLKYVVPGGQKRIKTTLRGHCLLMKVNPLPSSSHCEMIHLAPVCRIQEKIMLHSAGNCYCFVLSLHFLILFSCQIN